MLFGLALRRDRPGADRALPQRGRERLDSRRLRPDAYALEHRTGEAGHLVDELLLVVTVIVAQGLLRVLAECFPVRGQLLVEVEDEDIASGVSRGRIPDLRTEIAGDAVRQLRDVRE